MEARRPFDLEHGPLLRARFYRREGGEHALLVVVHHLVADFWSLARLARELSAAYAAAVRGTPVELPEVGATYLDFVRWQRALQEAFLVWDNAYGEIAGDELPRQVRANVVTVRSFSKCRPPARGWPPRCARSASRSGRPAVTSSWRGIPRVAPPHTARRTRGPEDRRAPLPG